MIPREELAAMKERSYCPDVVRLLAEVERLHRVEEAARAHQNATRIYMEAKARLLPVSDLLLRTFNTESELFAALDAAEGGE